MSRMKKDKWYIFTFGCGQQNEGKYVKIRGDYETARQKMVERYGLNWAFQYSEEQWNDWLERKPWYIPAETELDVVI